MTSSSATSPLTSTPGSTARRSARSSSDAGEPLGNGVWVLDASDFVDQDRAVLTIPDASPGDEFETVAFGPFLVIRTREPTETPEGFLEATLAVQELSAQLGVGDAARNAQTAAEALERLRGG